MVFGRGTEGAWEGNGRHLSTVIRSKVGPFNVAVRLTRSCFLPLGIRRKKETGCPILVNTSFNVRDEPIVCTPEDAFKCFMDTNIETLAIGNCYLRKDSQNQLSLKESE